MRLTDALDQIEEIHAQLARGEVYRGFQARAVALAGILGLLAAWAQPWLVEDSAAGFATYWAGMALVCGLLGGGAALRTYRATPDDFARRQTRRVAAQFLPCVSVGAVVTPCLLTGGAAHAAWLPGLWAVLFGLGLVATRPYVPRLVGAVAYFYLGCGGLLLARAASVPSLSGWSVGVPFGVGHLLTALALQLDREPDDE